MNTNTAPFPVMTPECLRHEARPATTRQRCRFAVGKCLLNVINPIDRLSPMLLMPDWRRAHGILTGILVALVSTTMTRAQQALVEPFRPGIGSWNLVKDGSFEIPRGDLVARTGYVLDGGWQLVLAAGSSGSARIDGSAAARGTNGVVILPGTFNGPGIALTLGTAMSLPAGVPHVLSGWVRRPNPSNSKATVYLDLWDIPGDIQVSVPARPGWQFVYGTFTPGGSPVGIRAVIDGNVQPSDEFQVDELAITPLSGFQPPEPQLGLFNVRFGTSDAAPIQGTAAYGEATNDFWNAYSRDDGQGGYKTFGSIVPLLDAAGTSSSAGLIVQNAPGAWGSGASDPLMALYLYPLGGTPRITLIATNLPTGFYDAYLYGHGGPGDTYNTAFTLTSGSLVHGTRKTTTNGGWQMPPWVEGRQFVRFTNVFITRRDPLVIHADRDAQYIPSLNGIQLVRRTSDRFYVFPNPLTFRGQLEVVSMTDTGVILRHSLDGSQVTTNSPILGPSLTLTNTTQLTVQAFEGDTPLGNSFQRDYVLIPSFDDEIPWEWRLKYFGAQAALDPRAAGAADPDKDGSDNLTEYRAGTSPMDPLDGFATGVRQIPSIRWTSMVGATYRILRKDKLPDSQWIEIKRVRATATLTEYIDPSVEGQPRFYRVEAVR